MVSKRNLANLSLSTNCPQDYLRYTTISCRTINSFSRIACRFEAMPGRPQARLKNKPGSSQNCSDR